MYACILPGTIKVKITHYTYTRSYHAHMCVCVRIHIAFEEKLPLYNLFVTFIYLKS